MRRIMLCGAVVIALTLPAGSAPAQVPPGGTVGKDNAVGVVLFMSGDQVTSLDVSFPAVATMDEIQQDLRAISQWTGWAMVGQPAETSSNAVSVHSQVTGGEVNSILNDAVWPIVGALARHPRLGIVVMGAPAVTARLTIENQFVRLEQSGGQGVQSYQAFIKSTGFRSLDELRQPSLPGAASTARPGSMVLAWLLVLIAAVAAGVAVYLLVNRLRQG